MGNPYVYDPNATQAPDFSGAVSWDEISRQAQDYGEYVGAKYKEGDLNVRKSSALANDGLSALVPAFFKAPEGQQYSLGSMLFGAAEKAGLVNDSDNYYNIKNEFEDEANKRKVEGYEDKKHYLDPRLLSGRTVTQIPQLQGMAVNAAGFGVTGAGVVGTGRAIEGSAVGGPIGGLFGAAEGAVEGFAEFASAGMTKFAVEQEYAAAYETMREAGMDRSKAAVLALPIGVTSGLIESFATKGLLSLGRKEFIRALKTQAGRRFMKHTTRRILGDLAKRVTGATATQMGKELLTEEAQTLLTDTISETLALALSGKEKWDYNKFRQRAIDNAIQTFQQALGPAILFPGLVSVSTKTAGAAISTTKKVVGGGVKAAVKSRSAQAFVDEQVKNNPKSVEMALEAQRRGELSLPELFKLLKQIVFEGLQNESPTQGQVDEAANMTVDQALGTLAGFGSSPTEDVLSGIGDYTPSDMQVSTDANGAQTFTLSIEVNEKSPLLQGKAGLTPKEAFNASRPTSPTAGVDTASTVDVGKEVVPATEPKVISVSTTESKAISGRKKQVQSEIADVNSRIAVQEKAFTKADSAGKATTAILNRLDKLYNQKELLEAERYLLEQGDLRPSELGNAKIQLTASQVLNARMKDLRRLVRNVRSALRRGEQLTKRNVRDLQTEITSVIRSAPIGLKDKAKLITLVRNTNSPESMQKNLDTLYKRVDEAIEAEAVRNVKEAIGSLLKNTKVKGGQGKFNPASQAYLDAMRTFLSLTEEQRQERYEAVASALGQLVTSKVANTNGQAVDTDIDSLLHELFEGDEQRIALAQVAFETSGYSNMSSDQLLAIMDNIQQALDDGRVSASERNQAREDRKAAIKQTIEAVGWTGTKDDTKTRKTLRQTFAQKWVDIYLAMNEGWLGTVLFLSPHDKSGRLSEMLSTLDAERAEQAGLRVTVDLLQDTLQKAFDTDSPGTTARQMKDVLASLKHLQEVTYTTSDGKVKTDRLTLGDVLKLYMLYQDPDNHEALHFGNGFYLESVNAQQAMPNGVPRISLEKILDDLPDDVKLVGDALLDFYDSYYNRINQFYRTEFGVNLPKRKRYSPGYKEGYETLKDNGVYKPGDFMGEFLSLTPGSTKARIKNSLPFRLTDPMTEVLGHINKFEHWFAWKNTVETIGQTLYDPKVKSFIEKQYSPQAFGILEAHYKAFVSNRGASTMFDKVDTFFNALQSRFVMATLGGKFVWQATQQIGAGFAAVDFMPTLGSVPLAVASMAGNSQSTFDALSESPIIASRYFNQSRDIQNIVQSQMNDYLAGNRTMADVLLSGLRLGDKAAIYLFGGLVYNSHINHGATHEQALAQTEKYVQESQQSGSLSQQSLLQRDFGFGGRAVTVFLSGANQLGRLSVRAVVEYKQGKITTAQFAKKIALYNVLIPTYYQFVRTGVPDEEKDWKEYIRSIANSHLGNTFIFGGILNYLTGTFLNQLGDTEQKVAAYSPDVAPLFTEPQDYAKFISVLGEYGSSLADDPQGFFKDNDFTDLFKYGAKALDGPTGLPLYTLYNTLTGLGDALEYGDIGTAMLAAGGWPRSSINERLLELDAKAIQSGTKPVGSGSEEDRVDNPGLVEQLMGLFNNSQEPQVQDYQPVDLYSEDLPDPEDPSSATDSKTDTEITPSALGDPVAELNYSQAVQDVNASNIIRESDYGVDSDEFNQDVDEEYAQ